MWQLAHLGFNPSLEVIGLVRYMSNHGAHLIVLTWFDYHSLIHTCGVEEKKILYIPYGISIRKSSKDFKLVEILSKYKDTDFVLLSIVSNHPNEDCNRLIRNLKSIISKISNFYLLIIVQESLTINSNLSQTVKNIQLENRVTWTNKSMSTNELHTLYKRANAYISLLDKTILTFVALLNAMSYGLPIISTPNIFSDEILNDDKGLIVSFDDDKIITESIIAFLTNKTRMKMFSKNGRESVKNWTWNNIAKQYTPLFNNSLKHRLTDDPYKTEMYWNNTGTMSFDRQDVFLSLAKDKAQPENINLEILRSNNEIKISFLKRNKFTNAFGLISSTTEEDNNTSKWFIPGFDIFSHSCEGQRLSISGMEHNAFILPENILQYSEEKSRKIQLIMDGRFFDRSSFASVNRKMFLSLITCKDLLVTIRPIDRTVHPNETALETLLVYSFFLRKSILFSKNKTIIFRNNWLPNLEGVSKNEILVHQQPWEFHAIPVHWLQYFQNKIDELWVPSEYGKSSYIVNGIDKNKIHVFPHGVFVEKFNLALSPFPLNTKKTFKFLSIGTTLPRKGFDVLLQAYNARFS
ncbi:unnamed protein product, partial [Adineta steineri]